MVTTEASADGTESAWMVDGREGESHCRHKRLTLSWADNHCGSGLEQKDGANKGCFRGSPGRELERGMPFQYTQEREWQLTDVLQGQGLLPILNKTVLSTRHLHS